MNNTVPTGPELKKLLAAFNKHLARKGQMEVSYGAIEADIRAGNNACSRSTIAQILNGKYDGGSKTQYAAMIYEALLRFGMPPASDPKTSQVKVDLLGFITINHRDYYVGGIRPGTIVEFEPGAEPNTIRLTSPITTGDLRPLDKKDSQLQPYAAATGTRRSPSRPLAHTTSQKG